MVRKGCFTVELVHATTNLPFKEHTKKDDSSTYVEVEPDAPYWVRVTNHHDDGVSRLGVMDDGAAAANEDEQTPTYVRLEVDGKDLVIVTELPPGQSTDEGISKKRDHLETCQAFQFRKNFERQSPENNHIVPFWIGTIKVRFYHATRLKTPIPFSDFVCEWNGGEAPAACEAGEKSLSSIRAATVATTTRHSQELDYFCCGELFETITLRYCTTVGLIYANVLPKPPMWEYHSMRFPPNTNNAVLLDPKLTAIQPTIYTFTVVDSSTSKLTITAVIFDLTHLDDYDDDDDDNGVKDHYPQQDASPSGDTGALRANPATDDSSLSSPDP